VDWVAEPLELPAAVETDVFHVWGQQATCNISPALDPWDLVPDKYLGLRKFATPAFGVTAGFPHDGLQQSMLLGSELLADKRIAKLYRQGHEQYPHLRN
jgi:hypothetical protein